MAEHEPSIGKTSDWYTPPGIFKASDEQICLGCIASVSTAARQAAEADRMAGNVC
jgi:hypothetical protein